MAKQKDVKVGSRVQFLNEPDEDHDEGIILHIQDTLGSPRLFLCAYVVGGGNEVVDVQTWWAEDSDIAVIAK